MVSKIYEVRDVDDNTLFFIIKSVRGGQAMTAEGQGSATWVAIKEDKDYFKVLVNSRNSETKIIWMEEKESIKREIVTAQIELNGNPASSEEVISFETESQENYFIGWDNIDKQPLNLPSADRSVVVSELFGWMEQEEAGTIPSGRK